MHIKSRMTEVSLKQLEKIVDGKLTLGRLLWAIRQSEEIKQVDFAEKLGITKQHLCDIEHGRTLVSPKLAASYAKKLGFSEKQFIRLSLQDIVNRDGLNMLVEVTLKCSLNLHKSKRARRPL
jgi:transcriptional regulator with XRE-family HTH domain